MASNLIDMHCMLFADSADPIDFIETDLICRGAARYAARPAIERCPSANFAVIPPLYYSLAEGVADNRRINDTLLRIGAGWGGPAFGVAEPKYVDAAREEIRRLASLGASGLVWSGRAQGVFINDHNMVSHCRLSAELGMISMIHSAPYSINESLLRIWDLANKCPDARIVALGALASWENIQTIQQHGGPANLWYDTAGIGAPRDLEGLVAAFGPEKLLFGSGGLRYLEAALDLVEACTLDEAARSAILGGNARTLLRATGTA